MTRIPDRLVERVHLGEASEAERARVLADPDARARLEALPAADAAFFEAHPTDATLAEVQRRARVAAAREEAAGASRGWTAGVILLGPVLAVLLALVLGPRIAPPGEATEPVVEPTRAKGLAARLRVYQQTVEGPRRLAPGHVLLKGDVLQVAYVSGDAAHGVIVSIDGRGAVTRHFPAEPGGPTALASGEHPLPEAYELDDAPDFERFFLVTAQDPLDPAVVTAAAEALARSGKARQDPLALPDGWQQTSLLVRKAVP